MDMLGCKESAKFYQAAVNIQQTVAQPYGLHHHALVILTFTFQVISVVVCAIEIVLHAQEISKTIV